MAYLSLRIWEKLALVTSKNFSIGIFPPDGVPAGPPIAPSPAKGVPDM